VKLPRNEVHFLPVSNSNMADAPIFE